MNHRIDSDLQQGDVLVEMHLMQNRNDQFFWACPEYFSHSKCYSSVTDGRHLNADKMMTEEDTLIHGYVLTKSIHQRPNAPKTAPSRPCIICMIRIDFCLFVHY
jgi:hypothetical protein